MPGIFKLTWKRLGVVIIAAVLGYFLWPKPESDTFLYLFYDGEKAGEKSPVQGVANSLKKSLPENTIQIEFDLKNKDAFLTDVRLNLKPESNNKGIVVTAGADSIDVLKQLNPQQNLVISHSSHQYTKDHASLKNVADIVALPSYVVTPDILGSIESANTVLIQTPGVPHNLSLNDIQEAYQKSKGILPHAAKYVGIILGGDAELPNGQIVYYTPKEAIQMAHYIASVIKEKKSHLLILNGPRTGKYNQRTGKVIEISHRDGKIDAVTSAFVGELKKLGLTEGHDFTLLDFQFGKPSAYPVVLGALQATNSPIFVAGESTTMISETADCLPGLVTAYTNGAMNENHKKHCFSEQAAGRINILEHKDGKWQLLKAGSKDEKSAEPASQLIAQAIMKRYQEKDQAQKWFNWG